MTSESFCALVRLAVQLEWNHQISSLRRRGADECGWMDMTGCDILYDSDINALQAVIEKREREDRKRLDEAAKEFVETWLKYDND